MAKIPDVFISLRFAEAHEEAKVLRDALEQRGVSCFLCAVAPGEDLWESITNALDTARLAVVMGTRTYGEDTGNQYCTHQELKFIRAESKPIFLIKMCERFENKNARWSFADLCYELWAPGTVLPEGLVAKIVQRLEDIARGVAATPSQAHVPGEQAQEKNVDAGGIGERAPPHSVIRVFARPFSCFSSALFAVKTSASFHIYSLS